MDTNCDPTGIDYPVPGNDDAIRAVRLITSRMADAMLEGRGTLAKDEAERRRIADGRGRRWRVGRGGGRPDGGSIATDWSRSSASAPAPA